MMRNPFKQELITSIKQVKQQETYFNITRNNTLNPNINSELMRDRAKHTRKGWDPSVTAGGRAGSDSVLLSNEDLQIHQ